MPYSITRVPTDNAAVRMTRSEALRVYFEQRLWQKYSEQHPDLMLDVVARRSDYDEVKVSLTQADMVNDAKAFLRQIEEELAAEGITFTYVRTWTDPAPTSGLE